MTENRFQRNYFDAQLVARALKEPEFRRRLVEDLRGSFFALIDFLGTRISW